MIHETLHIEGSGLTLHVHRFAPDGFVRAEDAMSVLLLHGFMDAGGTWSAVAERLSESGVEIYAPDFRGFGRSDRVTGGGYYHFADYVADTHRLVEQLAPRRLTVVGHSMGGTVASYYAGAMKDRVDRLVLMEGVGPPDMAPWLGPSRMRTWLAQLSKPKCQGPLTSLDAAVSRLAANHTAVDRDTLLRVAAHLTVERDGELWWAFDPLHRTTSPTLFRLDAFETFLAEIHCPVMFISGGASGWHPPGEAARLAAFPSPPEVVVLEGAGHMMHWTQPDAVADTIARFAIGR